MKRKNVNNELSTVKIKERNRRIKFLILMIISGLSAILTLDFPNFTVPNTPFFIMMTVISAVLVITFLISGVGLLANLFHWMSEE